MISVFFAWYSSSLVSREISYFKGIAETTMEMTDTALENLDSISRNFGYSELSKEYLFDDSVISTSPESLSSLSKLFIALNGTLQSLQLQKAQNLLIHRRDMSVWQVGQAVGYTDQDYFSRVFKKQTGMSPSEYRSNRS